MVTHEQLYKLLGQFSSDKPTIDSTTTIHKYFPPESPKNAFRYETLEDVYQNMKQFLEDVYNKKRSHSGIGYKPPLKFENEIREVLNTRIEA